MIAARTGDVRGSGVHLTASMLLTRALGRLDALLDFEIKTIVIGAWSRSREIRDYGKRSRRKPTTEFLLSLAEHVVRSEHHPPCWERPLSNIFRSVETQAKTVQIVPKPGGRSIGADRRLMGRSGSQGRCLSNRDLE
jgi:hypothetical protein